MSDTPYSFDYPSRSQQNNDSNSNNSLQNNLMELFMSHYFQPQSDGKPPASKLSVMELDFIVFDQNDIKKYEACSICTVNYKIGDEGKKMPCKHVFHTDCLVQWLSNNNSCPLCRFELPTNDIFYEEERLKRLYDNKDQDNNDSYSSMFL